MTGAAKIKVHGVVVFNSGNHRGNELQKQEEVPIKRGRILVETTAFDFNNLPCNKRVQLSSCLPWLNHKTKIKNDAKHFITKTDRMLVVQIISAAK